MPLPAESERVILSGHTRVSQPGSFPVLQCPQLLLRQYHKGRVDLIIGHILTQSLAPPLRDWEAKLNILCPSSPITWPFFLAQPTFFLSTDSGVIQGAHE